MCHVFGGVCCCGGSLDWSGESDDAWLGDFVEHFVGIRGLREFVASAWMLQRRCARVSRVTRCCAGEQSGELLPAAVSLVVELGAGSAMQFLLGISLNSRIDELMLVVLLSTGLRWVELRYVWSPGVDIGHG